MQKLQEKAADAVAEVPVAEAAGEGRGRRLGAAEVAEAAEIAEAADVAAVAEAAGQCRGRCQRVADVAEAAGDVDAVNGRRTLQKLQEKAADAVNGAVNVAVAAGEGHGRWTRPRTLDEAVDVVNGAANVAVQ